MALSPEQKAEIAQLANDFVSRTGWSPALAWAATAALISLGWYLAHRRPRSTTWTPTRLLVWVNLLNGAVFGGLTAWACYHALDVGRILCLSNSRSGRCGGGFVDAGGMHSAYENVFSMYAHPFGFWFNFLLVASLAVMAWWLFFWAARWLSGWVRE